MSQPPYGSSSSSRAGHTTTHTSAAEGRGGRRGKREDRRDTALPVWAILHISQEKCLPPWLGRHYPAMPCSLVCDSLVSQPSLGTPPHTSPHSGDSSEPGNSQDPPLHETRQEGEIRNKTFPTPCVLSRPKHSFHQSCKLDSTDPMQITFPVRDTESDPLWGWLGLGCETKLSFAQPHPHPHAH